jgi:uncharacterized membrane protein
MGQMHYLPLSLPFFALLVGAFLIVLVLIQIGILRYAYLRIGVSSRAAMFLLLGSLIGSYINIPIVELPERDVESGIEVSFFGMQYVMPAVVEWPGTVIAVNVGGALLSLYLLFKNRMWFTGLIATAVITAIVHMLAYPVPGVGIAVPVFVPPIATALVAALMAKPGGARLCERQPRHADRRRSPQSGRRPRARRSGRLDRWRRDLRRHFPHRHHGGAARRLVAAIVKTRAKRQRPPSSRRGQAYFNWHNCRRTH